MNIKELKTKVDTENEFKSSIPKTVEEIKTRALSELSTEIEMIRAKAFEKIGSLIDSYSKELSAKVESVKVLKGDKGDTPSDEHLKGLILPLIPPPTKPEKYILTTKDAAIIARKVKVPEVKHIEVQKTEVVKLQPIIEEVAKYETGIEIIAKINAAPAKYKIPASRISDHKNQEKIKKHGGGGSTSGSSSTLVRGEVVTFTGTSGTLAHTPVSGVALYRGNLRQYAGASQDYTLSSATITLNTAAASGEVFIADYEY